MPGCREMEQDAVQQRALSLVSVRQGWIRNCGLSLIEDVYELFISIVFYRADARFNYSSHLESMNETKDFKSCWMFLILLV